MAKETDSVVKNDMKTQEQDTKNKRKSWEAKNSPAHTKETRSDKNSQKRKIELNTEFEPKRKSPRLSESSEKLNLQTGRSPYVCRVKGKKLEIVETKSKKKIDGLNTKESQSFHKLLKLGQKDESIAEEHSSVCISKVNVTSNTEISVNRKRGHLEQPCENYKLRTVPDSANNNAVLIETPGMTKSIVIKIRQINESSSVDSYKNQQYHRLEKNSPTESSLQQVLNKKKAISCAKKDEESKVSKKASPLAANSLIKKKDIQRITKPERISLRQADIHTSKLMNRNGQEETSFKESDETLLIKKDFALRNQCNKTPKKQIKSKRTAVDTSGLSKRNTETSQTFLRLPVAHINTKITNKTNVKTNKEDESKTDKNTTLGNECFKRSSPRLIEIKTQKIKSKSPPDDLICKNVGHQKIVREVRNNILQSNKTAVKDQQKSGALRYSNTKRKSPRLSQDKGIEFPTIEQKTNIISNTQKMSPSAINFELKESLESLLIAPQLKSCNLSPMVILHRTPENTLDTQSLNWKTRSKDMKTSPANHVIMLNRKELRNTGEIKSSTSESKKTQCKRRRSSFVRGRIRISPMMSYTDLYKDIPVDLPEDQRLFMLCQSAFKFTLGQITASSQDSGFSLDFIDKVETTFANYMDKLQSDGVFKEAILPSGSQSTSSETEEMEKMAKYYEVYLDRLKNESQTWDDISTKYSDDMNQISEEAGEVSDDILNDEQKTLLSQKLNYQELLQELELMEQKLELKIDAVYNKANYYKRLTDFASPFIDDKKKILGAKSFAGIQDFLNPLKLLSNVIDSHDLTLPIQPC